MSTSTSLTHSVLHHPPRPPPPPAALVPGPRPRLRLRLRREIPFWGHSRFTRLLTPSPPVISSLSPSSSSVAVLVVPRTRPRPVPFTILLFLLFPVFLSIIFARSVSQIAPRSSQHINRKVGAPVLIYIPLREDDGVICGNACFCQILTNLFSYGRLVRCDIPAPRSTSSRL